MFARALLTLALGALIARPGSADAKEWLVERVSGTVWAMGQDRNPQRVLPRMSVPEGITVTTAADGRVRLTSDNSVMTLAPNSVVAVVPGSPLARKVNVLQKTGSVEFEVEKRAEPYFTVSSPYMAAVVKGTKFTIEVARKTTRIGVSRGLVQVTDIRNGQTSAIGAGQGAEVSSAKPGLSTAGRVAPQVLQAQPQTPMVPPVGLDLSEFRAQARQDAATRSDPVGRQGETVAPASSSSLSVGYSTGQAIGSGGRTNSVGGDGNGSGHHGNGGSGEGNTVGASGGGSSPVSNSPGDANGRGRGGPSNDGNGSNGGGNGQGNNGNGNGNGGGNGSNGGGNGQGNNGNGNGNGGGNGSNGGGNGQGNNGNGNGNGGGNGSNGGGNGQGNNGNGNGNGGGNGSNGGGNGQGNNGNGNGNGGGNGSNGGGNGKGGKGK